ncbi:MAG: GGDEF domain-containing protein [Actinomycetota bacterium]|nr:GGDEF domain-containing protein [Actinomycetota bacterium]
MSGKLVQRATVCALVLAALAGALAAHFVSADRLQSRRSDRVQAASRYIKGALGRRAFYLEDIADMVGVHDDADVSEFSRYANVRGLDEDGDESAMVGVQWVRRSPTGRLAPAGDVPSGTRIAEPILINPSAKAAMSAVDAAARPAAAAAIQLASQRKRPGISPPIRLPNGHAGFYLAAPVEAHGYSGDVSRLEARSTIVGLVDAQNLVTQAFEGHPPATLRLSDDTTQLASAGSALNHAVHSTVPAFQRRWALSIDGGSTAPLVVALPWIILAVGLGLALAVALVLRESNRRREAALGLARERTEQLEQAHAQALRRSREDPLTGVFNRRHFGEVLAKQLAHGRRGAPAPAVVLLDLDHFKPVNDAHGHLTGDAVIRETVRRIGSTLRGSDFLARWGGEEFVILAAGADLEAAFALAERARLVLAERPLDVEGTSISMTLSAGIAVAGVGETPDSLVAAADRALYAAKRAGRNRVLAAEPEGNTR